MVQQTIRYSTLLESESVLTSRSESSFSLTLVGKALAALSECLFVVVLCPRHLVNLHRRSVGWRLRLQKNQRLCENHRMIAVMKVVT